jgi:hypothetical protein
MIKHNKKINNNNNLNTKGVFPTHTRQCKQVLPNHGKDTD